MNIISGRFFQNFVIAIFLIIAFYFTVLGSYDGYINHNSWKIGDWLINYQGGFVRRGFMGEIIYHISNFSGYNLGVIVFLFQIIFYFLFFIFAYLTLINIKSLKAHWLLIFSPFLFYFQVFDVQGGFRKEIIFFAILAFVAWAANKYETEKLERIFYIVLLLYPLVILSHEMLAIYLPYIIIVYLLKIPLNKTKILYLVPLLSLSIITFIVTILNIGDQSIVTTIFNSLDSAGYKVNGGAISALSLNLDDGLNSVKNGIENKNYMKIYSITIVLALLSFLPISYKLNKILNNKIISFLFLISIVGSIGLALIALDWGRFIYINLISIFLISLVILRDEKEIGVSFGWIHILILSIVYFSFWHIPHCCGFQPIIQNIDSTNVEILINRAFR
jgi:hypothetical protein